MKRICHDCRARKDASEGFDTHVCGAGPAWVCWLCYAFAVSGKFAELPEAMDRRGPGTKP